jgi:hypothetical protein
MNWAKRYPGNIASTNHTDPRRVIFRYRRRGEKHGTFSCRRNPAAARCSCFGCVRTQNQSGVSKTASSARERVIIRGIPTEFWRVRNVQDSFLILWASILRATFRIFQSSDPGFENHCGTWWRLRVFHIPFSCAALVPKPVVMPLMRASLACRALREVC